MVRGLDTAAAGMIAAQRWHDTITHNLANVNTPGFKAEETLLRTFPEVLISVLGAGRQVTSLEQSRIGSMAMGVLAQENLPLFEQGSLRQTDIPTHLAIADLLRRDGEGPVTFFAVLLPDGTVALTRNGQWTRDAEGNWVTPQGYPLLDINNQPINASLDARITEDGTIWEGEVNVGTLRLVEVANPLDLIRDGQGLYHLPEEAAIADNTGNARVQQGFLENSNVDITRTMANLILAQRTYQANQQVIRSYDAILDKTVNEVGRLR